MKTPNDFTLQKQARVYALRFTCPDCVYFDALDESCSEGYPNGAHRDVDLDLDEEIVFCKRFELV